MAIKTKKLWLNFIYSINPITLYNFTKRINGLVGTRFLIYLSYNYYLIKGFLYSFIGTLLTPYFREHNLDNFQLSIAATIGVLPWSLKGFIGIISDLFPIFGYSKTSYLLIVSVLASIGSLVIICTPDDALFRQFQVPALMVFFINLQGSAADLLGEGKYVEKMKSRPESRGDIVTYVWWCQMFGGFTPPLIIGPLSEVMNMRWLFIVVLPLVMGLIPILLMGCMVDDKVAPERNNRINVPKFKQHWRLFLIGLLMGSLTLALVIVGVIDPEAYLFMALFSLLGSLGLCILVLFFMPKVIGRAVCYLFLTTATYGGTGSSTTYWLFGEEDCVPNGPNLSYTTVITWGGLMGSICSLIGVWAYSFFISKLKIRAMMWITTVIRILSGLTTIFWIFRWNVVIGIPDIFFYLFVDIVVGQIAYIMDFMPLNLLIAKLCPKSVEVTVYAILAGFSNFGNSVASYYGIILAQALGIYAVPPENPGDPPCNFDNLALLVALVAMIFPSVQIPLTFVLVPSGYIDDDLLGETAKTSKTSLEIETQQLGQSVTT